MKLSIELLDKKVNSQTRSLDLSKMELTIEDLNLLYTYLDTHPEITSLDLSYNSIRGMDFIFLAYNNKTITNLNISNNSIDDLEAIILAKNQTIVDLNVSNNTLKDFSFNEFLTNNTSIKILDVSINYIIFGKYKNLMIDSLKKNSSLVEIKTDNFSDKEIKNTIDKVCARNAIKIPVHQAMIASRLFFKAQEPLSDEQSQTADEENICHLASIPKEVAGLIFSYAAGNNDMQYSFFLNHIKKPEEGDLDSLKSHLTSMSNP